MSKPLWLSAKAQASPCIKNLNETLDALKEYQFKKANEVTAVTPETKTIGDHHGVFRVGPIANKAQYEKILRMIDIRI